MILLKDRVQLTRPRVPYRDTMARLRDQEFTDLSQRE